MHADYITSYHMTLKIERWYTEVTYLNLYRVHKRKTTFIRRSLVLCLMEYRRFIIHIRNKTCHLYLNFFKNVVWLKISGYQKATAGTHIKFIQFLYSVHIKIKTLLNSLIITYSALKLWKQGPIICARTYRQWAKRKEITLYKPVPWKKN